MFGVQEANLLVKEIRESGNLVLTSLVDEADKYSALVPCLCVFKPLLVNRENPKQVTKINSLSSVLAVMKGVDLATQQVIVAGNTIVVTHLVLFLFFISLFNTWM